MNAAYYIQINVMSIIMLLLMFFQFPRKQGIRPTETYIFRLELLAAVVLCLADMFSGILRGQLFTGARVLTEIANSLYIVMMTFSGYLWLIYVNTKLNKATRSSMIFWSLPLVIIVIIAISNPWTNIFFSLGENNIYVRSSGIYFHWLFSWLYILIPTIEIIWILSKEKNRNRKKELMTLLYFFIPPAVAGLIQMSCYGISCFQCGIMISLFIIFIREQNSQILTDVLTGLNNRRGLEKYLDERLSHHENLKLTVLMLDIDNFKQINDQYSHMDGDEALKETAGILKQCCSEAPTRLFICRYGGDEFVIVGHNLKDDYTLKFKERVQQELQIRNQNNQGYSLMLSIGIASGYCNYSKEVEQLFRKADEQMYQEKKKKK